MTSTCLSGIAAEKDGITATAGIANGIIKDYTKGYTGNECGKGEKRMKELPKGYPRVTVREIFLLIDWNGEGNKKVCVIPGNTDSMFEVPSRYWYLSDELLNSHVDSLSAEHGNVCIWVAGDWDLPEATSAYFYDRTGGED